jgi:hypothetical protein
MRVPGKSPKNCSVPLKSPEILFDPGMWLTTSSAKSVFSVSTSPPTSAATAARSTFSVSYMLVSFRPGPSLGFLEGASAGVVARSVADHGDVTERTGNLRLLSSAWPRERLGSSSCLA